jgi:hypothetical protein
MSKYAKGEVLQEMVAAHDAWQPVGTEGNRLQKRLAGPYFTVFFGQ